MTLKKSQDTFYIVKQIAQLLEDKGGKALLVGGCVRDSIMGIPSKDFDLEVYNLSCDEIKDALAGNFELDLVGMSFGVMKVKHFDIDIALPRTENKTGLGHKGFMVEMNPNLSFALAAARRDFTVNAIMQNPLTNEIIDPWGGLQDINNKVLKHVSSHFSEDPLRVLRGMQFVGRFNFTCDKSTLDLCKTLSQNELAKERLAQEWEKLLIKGTNLSNGLKFLVDCQWIKFYPTLDKLYQKSAKDNFIVWDRLLAKVDHATLYRNGNYDDDLILMVAALCQEFSSSLEVREFISQIWNKNTLLEYVVLFLENLPQAKELSNPEAPEGQLRRLALKIKKVPLFLQVVKAVTSNMNGDNSLSEQLYNNFKLLNIHMNPPEPIIQGRHLMALGIPSGPQMGKVLKQCFEAQLDGVFNNLEDGLVYLHNFI
jgi:tRNA nucleotidyltransferase (CCA-adding enzyme)